MIKLEGMLPELIDKSPSSFILLDKTGNLLLWNASFREYTGYTDKELHDCNLFYFFEDKDKSRVLNLIDTAYHYGFSEAELELNTKDKRSIFSYVSCSHIKTEHDVLIICNMYDISIRIETELELKDAIGKLNILKEDLEDENLFLKHELDYNHGFEGIISEDSSIVTILTQIKDIATTDAPVLIVGETGTGKKVISQQIHNNSSRKEMPFVKINCNTLNPELFEMELYGKENPSMEEILSHNFGKIEMAKGGTLLLEEINKMPSAIQEKFTKTIETKQYKRIGGTQTIDCDIRIISTSSESLSLAVANKQFNSELFYKLNIFPFYLPPLRERKDDIILFVNYFVKIFNAKYGHRISQIPKAFIKKLQNYNWPGNILELKSIIERGSIISPGNVLTFNGPLFNADKSSNGEPIFKSYINHEKDYIIKVLNHTHWRVRGPYGAAAILNLKPTTLESKMKRLQIEKPFKTN